MIHIDGSRGEGGGQVLRTSLALSILTGQPFEINHLRARRSKPGLMPQHLKAVDAAAAISRAQVEGAYAGSQSLTFHPGSIRSGRYKFDIGTAGSTLLVLQTVFLPLSRAGSASSVIITGGTHVPKSPCFQYIQQHWLEFVRRIGCNAELALEQAGFYPAGGGRISATIRAAGTLTAQRLGERGSLLYVEGVSAVSNLDVSIADRQRRQALRRLEGRVPEIKIRVEKMPSPGKGTLLLLRAVFEHSSACFFSLGELGKPAERVADEAVEELMTFLDRDGAVDAYLADQLLLPLAFANGPSEIRTRQVTNHLLTQAEILESFSVARLTMNGREGEPGTVHIQPVPL